MLLYTAADPSFFPFSFIFCDFEEEPRSKKLRLSDESSLTELGIVKTATEEDVKEGVFDKTSKQTIKSSAKKANSTNAAKSVRFSSSGEHKRKSAGMEECTFFYGPFVHCCIICFCAYLHTSTLFPIAVEEQKPVALPKKLNHRNSEDESVDDSVVVLEKMSECFTCIVFVACQQTHLC